MVSSVAERTCALLLLVGASYGAVAQEEMNSAFVTVAVSDTLGGAIPSARVHVLQHLAKNEIEKLTDETGNATLELQPGRFDLTVTGPPGFLKSVITDVDVQRGEHRRMNVVLKVKTSDCCIDFVDPRIEPESAKSGDLEEPTKQSPREQTDFGSDSDLDRPIPVPQVALDALRSALKAKPDELLGDKLKASEIHLAGPAETDLIVPRVAGGHAAFFYILRPTASGYKLIFDSGGDGMTVLRTRSHGYRDLKVWGFTQAGRSQSTAIYKFNGLGYVKVREKTESTN